MMPMRIALDATPLTVPTGGVRRYVDELTQALAREYPDDRLFLLSDQPFTAPEGANIQCGALPRTAAARRWWTWGIQREMSRLAIDVFHGTDFATPYLPSRPSLMTLHDLSPWRDETAGEASRRVRRRTPLLLALGLATIVVTPTEAVRREALERFKLRPDRVVAIPLAASAHFRPVPVSPGRPYFLHVGTLEKRKNLTVLLDAWREVRLRHEVDLVLAGRARDGFQLPPDPGIRLAGAVADDELPALYSGAAACLNPSFYEGFGLPALEAMQCGALVITSKDPAISEVTGDAAVRIDADDPRGWAEAMLAALNEDHRRVWAARSIARAAEFSWEKTARLTREAYEEARRRF